MAVLDTSRLIDKLYDAVLDLNLWPAVIEDIADTLGGAGSALLSNKQPAGIWVRVDPAARALFEQRFISRNPVNDYVTHIRQSKNYQPAIITDADISARVNLHRTDYYDEFLKPYDGAYSLAFDLGVFHGGMTAALNLSRTRRQGAFSEREIGIARALHPHVMRSFWLSMKLSEKAALGKGVVGLLESARFGIVLFDSCGRIAHANKLAGALMRMRNGLRCEDGSLYALRRDVTARLQKLIADAVSPDAGIPRGGALRLPRPLCQPLTVTVTPLRSDRPQLFEPNPSAIACVFDPTAPSAVSTSYLRGMFGLSPAEARVAMKLIAGLNQKEIARSLGVSYFTVRAHLAQIFQKTSTNRQSEFVSLAMRSIGPAMFGPPQ